MADINLSAKNRESHRLRERFQALEIKAGIRDEHERFNETNSGFDLRRLYFSVRDKALRKELIASYREFLRHGDGFTPSLIRDAQADLQVLECKGFSTPWFWPSVGVTCTVYTGWSIAALPGALAGAVVGLFIGNAYVSDRRNAYARNLSVAKNRLAEFEAERQHETQSLRNLWFSEQEEQSGAADEGREPDLHWFARAGMDWAVAREIERGKNLETENNERWGSRPLHRAAAAGNASTVKLLLEAGADPNSANKLLGFTPLHSAAAAGSSECIQELLAAGANIRAKDRFGLLPLHRAVESSDAATVLALARAGSPIEEPSDSHGNTPLHLAAMRGHYDVVEALLSAGANPFASNSGGLNPSSMTFSGKGRRFDRTRELLLKAAGVRQGDSDGPRETLIYSPPPLPSTETRTDNASSNG